MIKTTMRQTAHVVELTKSKKFYEKEKVWNFLTASILSNKSSQKNYLPLFCDALIPIDSHYDIWFEPEPIRPRKGVSGDAEGTTHLDLAFGSVRHRETTASGIEYDPKNDDEWICFVEGKLRHDLSPGVKHDSDRNQMIRTIENLLCFQGEYNFPKKLYFSLLTPQAYKNESENKDYFNKFNRYKSKENILKDLKSPFNERTEKEWKYPNNIEERLKLLTINWVTYEDIIGREFKMSDLDLTNLNDKQKKFFSNKLDKLVTYYRSYLTQP